MVGVGAGEELGRGRSKFAERYLHIRMILLVKEAHQNLAIYVSNTSNSEIDFFGGFLKTVGKIT